MAVLLGRTLLLTTMTRKLEHTASTPGLPPRQLLMLCMAVAALVMSTAGGWHFERPVRAESRIQDATARTAAQTQSAGPASPLSLGFDLPADFWNREADGSYAVSGLRIGYFPPNGSTPLLVVEVPRATVKVNGSSGQIPLEISRLPPGTNRVEIRLQTLSGRKAGAWSEASPLIGSPVAAPPPRQRQTAARRPQSVALADV